MSEPRQLVLRESPYCDPCPANQECGERWTALGCSPDFSPFPAGEARMLHPSLPDFLPRIAEVNGLALDIRARPQVVPTLPGYIPRIRPWKRIGGFHDIPAVAVPLGYVGRLAGAVEARGCTAKAILGLSEDQQLIVTGFESDRFLERAWPRPQRMRLLRAIRVVQPDAAVAWGYSAWHQDAAGRTVPRIEHLYNLKRTLVVYASLQDLDVPAIPHVYGGVRDDLLRWSDWLAQNPCVSTIAMDLQTVDTDADWAQVIRDVEYFSGLLPRDIRCLFSGVCQVSRVQRLREAWPNAALSNFGPHFSVVFPQKVLFGLSPRPERPEGWSYAQIFRDTVSQYTELIRDDGPAYPTHDSAETGPGLLPPMSTHPSAPAGSEEQFPITSPGFGKINGEKAGSRV